MFCIFAEPLRESWVVAYYFVCIQLLLVLWDQKVPVAIQVPG